MNDITSEIGLLKRQVRDVQSVTGNVQYLMRKLVDGRASVTDRPGGLVTRAALCSALGHLQGRDADDVARECFAADRDLLLTLRAAVSPANSTTATWAAELVSTITQDVADRLIPQSVFVRLAEQGLSYPLVGNSVIKVPVWSPSATGAFVVEAGAIPVNQLVITALNLRPKKAAVIIAATDELLLGAAGDAETNLRTILGEAVGLMIDGVLLSSAAVTAAAPAGLLNGISPLTAVAGGGSAAMIGDVKQLTAAIAPALKPIFITGPIQAATLSLLAPMSNPNGMLILISPTLAAGTVIAVDAAAFASALGVPSFRASQNVTLHEDTAATALSTVGTPANVVAAPMRSAFQSDVTALRSIIPVDWALRRTGAIAYTTGTTW